MVGVDHELDICPDSFPDCLDPCDISRLVFASHFDLNCPEPAVHIGRYLVEKLIDGIRKPAAASVDWNRVATGTKELVDGAAESFAQDVPECNVDSGNSPRRKSALPDVFDLIPASLPNRADQLRVHTDGDTPEFMVDDSFEQLRTEVKRQHAGVAGDSLIRQHFDKDPFNLVQPVRGVGKGWT